MTEYLINSNPSVCCGCGSCEQICPKNAIKLEPNDEGFLYPVLNKELCVECGLCKKGCPNDNEPRAYLPSKAYAFWYNDDEKLKRSASGGAFIAFADSFIENGGYVAGCVFDNFVAKHIITNDYKDVCRMQGSKYVQSQMGDTYFKTKKLLNEGKSVLFSGTPCQIDGLYKFLGKNYDNLLTLDLICHGVPSPALLKEHISYKEKKLGKVNGVTFRDKRVNGWGTSGYIAYEKNGKSRLKEFSPATDCYYQLFIKGYTYRQSCYACKYANEKRVSDITIGDYWGIRRVFPDIDFKRGISCVLINTQNGYGYFEKIKDKVTVRETDYPSVQRSNGNLVHPTEKSIERDDLYKKIKKNGLKKEYKRLCRTSEIKPKLKRFVKKILRRL